MIKSWWTIATTKVRIYGGLSKLESLSQISWTNLVGEASRNKDHSAEGEWHVMQNMTCRTKRVALGGKRKGRGPGGRWPTTSLDTRLLYQFEMRSSSLGQRSQSKPAKLCYPLVPLYTQVKSPSSLLRLLTYLSTKSNLKLLLLLVLVLELQMTKNCIVGKTKGRVRLSYL